MELDLKDKTVLITGGSSGLGFATAQSFLEERCKVFIAARDPERLKKAVQSLSRFGNVGSEAGDLTHPPDIERIIREAEAFLGKIDILVLSTGHPPTFPSREASPDRWNEGFDLLLRPAIQMTRELAPKMAKSGYGRLIYIGSIFGLQPEPTSIIQSTFRTGLNAFAKCISTEFALAGVTANVICPGYFDTPLVRDLAKQYADRSSSSVDKVLEEWRDFAPAKKFGKPEDLGALAAFLASPRGEFISGTAITIDGGAILQY